MRLAERNVLVNVVGVNVPLQSFRLLTPCCRNNLSQAPFSSCHSYSRTLRAEHPGAYHIKSKLFSLVTSVVLSNWSVRLLYQQTDTLQSIQADWLAFLCVTFLFLMKPALSICFSFSSPLGYSPYFQKYTLPHRILFHACQSLFS